jgi:formylglycine-generating enzyme required for sulfatase activity
MLHTFTMRDMAGEVIEWVRIYLHPDEASLLKSSI